MPLNHYVTLGKSGLRVSPFCLGTMTFGLDWGWGSDEKDSHAILSRFIELGGNFLDTANLYTKGHSEAIIGDFLSKNSVRRDQLVLATKFFGSLYSGDPNAGGAGRKSIYSALENSLRRLKTDYIDLYWMHCWDKHTPIEETMSTLNDLVREGRIRYIGFSDTPAWKTSEAMMISKFRGWSPLVALQIEYSLLERTVEGEIMPMAQEYGLGVTPWSPLKYGILAGKFKREDHGKHEPGRGEWVKANLTDHTYDIVEEVVAVAKELGTSPARVALAWLQNKPGVTSSIIGARTMQQLDDNVAALEMKLSEEQMKKLDEISKAALNFPHDFINRAGAFRSSGTTINGETNDVNPLAPTSEKDRFDKLTVAAR